jgi:polyisoprenyl-teichoic acid--peptidoglycan teichoic acid transferase
MARKSNRASLFPLLQASILVIVGGLFLAGLSWWRQSAAQPRTNVLILGLDRRPEDGYIVRSDVIMLLTCYPSGPRIGVISIPRDLYVGIPGYGAGRINTAYFWGEAYGAQTRAEGGGPALAMQAVTQNFGVPVHHYVRVDFEGFRAIVDAVGGIDIFVEEPIVDNAYPTDDYGVTRIEIPAGLQRMDGEMALRYARSRSHSSDFDRLGHQQQIFIALLRRIFDTEIWPDLPSIYQVVMDNVDTDLTFEEIILLAPTLYRVGPDGIELREIGREMADPWIAPTGANVLLPRWDTINPVMQDLFFP